MIIKGQNVVIKSGSNPISHRQAINSPFRPISRNEWIAVCNYVSSCTDIRSSVCRGCYSGKMYDKNNKEYKFGGAISLEGIKTLIENIRKINSFNE